MAVRQMLVADRYRLLEPVGTGGMGRVWLSRDEMLDRDVAVKEFVPPEWMTDDEKNRLRDRTLREARSAARLNHPHVVRIYDVVHAEGLPWIVMEYVPSRSLHEVIEEDGPLAPAPTARIGLDVLDALTAAHRAGVLHRDVKPHNVLIGVDGRVVLTDFGLATFVDDGSVTGPGLVVGSPQYVSPERARDGASTVESDLWSLGATLYAAVEGRSPYARDSAMATLMALATDPPDPPVLAGPLTPVLTGLLRHEPADRLTAAEVKQALLAVVAAAPAPVPPVARAVVPARRGPAGREMAVNARAKSPAKVRNAAPAAGPAAAPVTAPPKQPAVTAPPKQPPVAAPQKQPPAAPPEQPPEADPPEQPPVADPPEQPPTAGPPKQPATAAQPASRPTPAGDEPVPPRPPRWSRARAIVVRLLTLAVLAAAGGVGGYLAQRDDGPRSVGPISPGSSDPVVRPGGFSPLACAGPAPPDAPRTPQPEAPRTMKGWDLLDGFSAFTDPSGFRLAVPDGWTYERVDSTLCFRDPENVRILSLNDSRDPAGDPVQACRKEADRLVESGAVPGYRQISLEPSVLAGKAADWEYTYTGPRDMPMHAITRWFVAEDRGYALGWVTREFDWSQSWDVYRMIQGTFEASA